MLETGSRCDPVSFVKKTAPLFNKLGKVPTDDYKTSFINSKQLRNIQVHACLMVKQNDFFTFFTYNFKKCERGVFYGQGRLYQSIGV